MLAIVADQKEWIQKMRNATDGSFVYFTYAVSKSSELFNPYMLKLVPIRLIHSNLKQIFRVVNYREVDKNNFFTMSAKGVMQHVGSEVIFTSLDKWEAEFDMFQRLMKIKTFRMFRKWKGFYVWRKNIIFAKFITAQKNLNHNMFILNPMLRQGLLDIQYMCYKMVDNSFVDLSENSNIWLFYFIENQVNNY